MTLWHYAVNDARVSIILTDKLMLPSITAMVLQKNVRQPLNLLPPRDTIIRALRLCCESCSDLGSAVMREFISLMDVLVHGDLYDIPKQRDVSDFWTALFHAR